MSKPHIHHNAVAVGMMLWFGLWGCSTPPNPPQIAGPVFMFSQTIPQEIKDKMSVQEVAWSNGDVETFMSAAYAPNDSLLFIGSKGLTLGFQEVLSHYRKSYPTGNAMGELTFENMLWKPLGREHGLLVGSWHLNRGEGLENLGGHYSLIWQFNEADGEWQIVADHSS